MQDQVVESLLSSADRPRLPSGPKRRPFARGELSVTTVPPSHPVRIEPVVF